MKNLLLFFGLIICAILLFGCGKKFHLEREIEYKTSVVPYGGGFNNAMLPIQDGGFSGDLNVKWRSKVSGVPIGPLAIADGKLIVCTSAGRVFFFDTKDGRYLGKYKSRANVQTGLTVFDSLAYFSLAPFKNRFMCVNLHNQKTVWQAEIKDVTGSPIINNNRLYLAAASGLVECRNRIIGNLIWQDTVGAKSLAGPSCDEGIVYFPFDNGKLIGFDELTGKMIINVDLEQPLVSKVSLGNMIFVSGVAGIFSALDKKTGAIVWERSFDWPVWTSPAVDDKTVYVGDNGGFIRALDIKDGHTIWSFQTEGVILSAPIIVGNYLIFGSLDRFLYCLDKRTGLLNSKWKNKYEVRFPAISDGESIYVAAQDGSIYSLGE